MSIELANESGIDVPVDLVLDAARFAIDRMDVHPGAELSVICVDLDTMADLHMRWMDLPGPTDVMSCPMDELTPGSRQSGDEPGPATLGDIVLCPEFAKTQAKQARHSFDHELAVLTVHGVLHLLGYDHAEPEEEREMFGLQAAILDEWYSDRRLRDRSKRQSRRDEDLLRKTGLLDPDGD